MGSDLLLVQREDRSVYTGRVGARISPPLLRNIKKTRQRLMRREKQSVTRRVSSAFHSQTNARNETEITAQNLKRYI